MGPRDPKGCDRLLRIAEERLMELHEREARYRHVRLSPKRLAQIAWTERRIAELRRGQRV